MDALPAQDEDAELVALALPARVLSRLLRERSLVVSEFRCLDRQSGITCREALKASLKGGS